MRYMMFVKSAQDRGRPPQALIAAIDKLATAARNEGRMLGGGELGPLRDGARVCLAGGNITVLESPPSGKDVIAGYVQLEFGSKEDAIASATKFLEVHRQYWPGWEGETEIRELFSPGEFVADRREGS